MKKLSIVLCLHLSAIAAGLGQPAKPGGASNSTAAVPGAIRNGHPAWIIQGNVYEVNVRQYTVQGTFNAFAQHLGRLKQMGVQTLWFMPINPISVTDRKGSLGSYYAVSDYTAVNPEFGTLADFKKLVSSIHNLSMKVIIDWVPNHTGADHRWLRDHPDFYEKDSTGNAAVPFGWTDTRQLDYKNTAMQDSMIACMKYWIDATGIDGFRCDVAWNVPGPFWARCIGQLKKMKSIFMLAEGDKAYLLKNGFDATYPWDMFHMMAKVAKGERPAIALDSIRNQYNTDYPQNAMELYFTSNHDENSWNQADYAVFPGASHAPFAVFTQTMAGSIPLIYSGQEEPVLRAIKFFDKDTIQFGKFSRVPFYKTLLALHKRNAALAADAAFRKVVVGDEDGLYAYIREKAGKKVLVILNLSASQQTVTVKDKDLPGDAYNVFMGVRERPGGKSWMIEPWGYAVYEYGVAGPGK
ncbi:MAG TPA: alpha-amylase family glycosyl hydrolase [Puia sp.]|nr:alpha-amylase family glycosyl hydrolase [Puia sp.]